MSSTGCSDAFGYRERADGSVAISYRGRVVTTLRHEAAARFLARAAGADSRTVQGLMARATGNFRRGNERR